MFRTISLASQLPLLFIFLLIAHASFIFALPSPQANSATDSHLPIESTNDTITDGTYFRSEPRGRGTVGVIFSCTATYIFCVWTAMHPNINAKSSRRYRLWYKLILMVFSIFIPEGLLTFAYGQWEEARKLRKAWEEHFPVGTREHTMLGMDGAFFVVMGGFLVDEIQIVEGAHEPTSRSSSVFIDSKPESLPDRQQRVYITILTSAGFKAYLRDGYIDGTSFDKRAIQDKSKTNTVAKVLAFSQALWLIVQSCARRGQNLPLSILEIHVLIQVLCTIIIYICWWSKPLDVEEPIKIKFVNTSSVTRSSVNIPPDLTQKDQLDKEIEKAKHNGKKNHLIVQQPYYSSSKILSKAVFDLFEYIPSEVLAVTDKNAKVSGSKDSIIVMVTEGTILIVVGGLHLLAWNVHFPTPEERLLWRICSIGIVLIPPIVVIIASINRYERDVGKALWGAYYERYTYRQLFSYATTELHHACDSRASKSAKEGSLQYSWILYTHYALIYMGALLVVMYDLCTIYIVVESYVSMRGPPADVFTTPRWNDYWPHL